MDKAMGLNDVAMMVALKEAHVRTMDSPDPRMRAAGCSERSAAIRMKASTQPKEEVLLNINSKGDDLPVIVQ